MRVRDPVLRAAEEQRAILVELRQVGVAEALLPPQLGFGPTAGRPGSPLFVDEDLLAAEPERAHADTGASNSEYCSSACKVDQKWVGTMSR